MSFLSRLNCLTLPLVFAVASCATMFNSGNQSMQVSSSDGKSHNVYVSTPDGTYTTQLPTTVVAPPSTFQDVEIKIKEDKCLNPSSAKVDKGITLSFWANLLNVGFFQLVGGAAGAGLLGFAIDAASGAMWNYDSHTMVTVSKKSDCMPKSNSKG